MLNEEIIQFYTTFAENYDEVVLRDKDYIAFEKIPNWIITRLPLEKPRILDLGCGTGLSSKYFLEKGFKVTGIDITPKMVEQCRKLSYEKLLCQSLEEPIPIESGQFEAAVMLGVMEFMQNPQALFLEVARLLKDHGLFGITVPKKISAALEEKLAITTYHLPEVEQQFAHAQFVVLHSEEFQGFRYAKETVHYCGYLLKKDG